jgi:acetylornithine/succinyldiaminopimelate/putrescine aminotransferase
MMGLKLKDDFSGPILTKTAYDNDLLMVYANNDQSVCQCLPPLNMDLGDMDYVMTQLDKALSSAKLLRPIAKGKRAIDSIWKKITNQ